MSRKLEPKDIKKSVQAWADITLLSLELKLAELKKRQPELSESELRELIRKELIMLKEVRDNA